jgi:tRNA threonylcarbamoyladenosine modification (KEOPS) complex Cgi121 subunit
MKGSAEPGILDDPDAEVAFTGLLGPFRRSDLLFLAGKSGRIAPLQLVRSDRVVGPAHVVAAARHAKRAIAEGRAQAERPEVEFVRYLAGARQIKDALERMGLPEEVDGAVAVAFGPKRLDALQHFLHAAGAEAEPGLVEATPEKLAAFGVTPEELEATTPERRLDIALERVAAVDLM